MQDLTPSQKQLQLAKAKQASQEAQRRVSDDAYGGVDPPWVRWSKMKVEGSTSEQSSALPAGPDNGLVRPNQSQLDRDHTAAPSSQSGSTVELSQASSHTIAQLPYVAASLHKVPPFTSSQPLQSPTASPARIPRSWLEYLDFDEADSTLSSSSRGLTHA